MVNKLMSDKLLKNPEAIGLALNLIRLDGTSKRAQSDQQTRRVLTDQQQRDLIQKIMNEVTAFRPQPGDYSQERNQAMQVVRWLQSMGPDLDEVLSGAAATLDKKSKELSVGNETRSTAMSRIQNESPVFP
jgi:hypothetical protein